MNLTTFAFHPPKDAVLWTDDPTRVDPADHPAWAVWESACGHYRVVFDGSSDTFSPQHCTRGDHGHVEWTPLSTSHHSLYAAQEVCHA